MVITPHMLVGAAVGSKFGNPWLVFTLGLLSHYLLDALPHWDYLKGIEIKNPDHLIKIGLDFILGGFFVFLLTYSSEQRFLILIALLGALLPDILEVIYCNFNIKWLRPLSLIHHKIHYPKRLSFWAGLPATLAVCLIAVYLLWDKWG